MKTWFFVLLSATIISACSNEEVRKENASLNVNDVAIVYDQCGKGDTTLLFVHGWCINKDYWDAQSSYFCDKYNSGGTRPAGFWPVRQK